MPEIDFVLAFVAPALILSANVFFKWFWLNRGVELVGADVALCGFSVLFTQALRTIHFSRLPADLIILTIFVLFVVLFLWFLAGGLVRKPRGYSIWAVLASWALGGLVFYGCTRYWAFVQVMGYKWG